MGWQATLEWISQWIPAVFVGGVLAFIGRLIAISHKARTEGQIKLRVDKAIEIVRAELRAEEETLKADLRGDVETQIERLKAELRRDEEALKARLRAGEEQVAALRTGALSGLTARQALLDKRRLKATEKLWAEVVDMNPLRTLAEMSKVLKMTYILEKIEKGENMSKAQQAAELTLRSTGLIDHKPSTLVNKDQIFISPDVFALFTAYQIILYYPYAQFTAMRHGAGISVLAPETVLAVAKEAMPHQAKFLEAQGTEGLPYIIGDLHKKLLSTIISSLSGSAIDKAAIDAASNIISLAEAAQERRNQNTMGDIDPTLKR